MTTREQLTAERLAALVEVLVAEGAIPRDWADSLAGAYDLEHGAEIAKAAREGRGPPAWSNSTEQGASDAPGNSGNSGESN